MTVSEGASRPKPPSRSPANPAAPTTLKVSSATRDRLKAMAKRDQCTIDQYLNKLIAMADRELRWDALRASIAKMTAEDWAEYMAEADPYVPDEAWDGVTVDAEWQDEWNAHLARQAALENPGGQAQHRTVSGLEK